MGAMMIAKIDRCTVVRMVTTQHVKHFTMRNWLWWLTIKPSDSLTTVIVLEDSDRNRPGHKYPFYTVESLIDNNQTQDFNSLAQLVTMNQVIRLEFFDVLRTPAIQVENVNELEITNEELIGRFRQKALPKVAKVQHQVQNKGFETENESSSSGDEGE